MENALVSRVGMLDFHFCLYGLEGAYRGGFYHGLLQLHENYPFRAPKLFFYTPSGRFEINTPICTSFTHFHQETWTSAWNIRTLIVATISFMYTEEPSFGCRTDSEEDRRKFARQSRQFNLKNTQFVSLFAHKLVRSGENLIELKNWQDDRSDELIHRG
jgi:ubiquitin-conjugating enzyme E2 J2